MQIFPFISSFRFNIVVFDAGAISSFHEVATPFGNISVDKDVRNDLIASGLFDMSSPNVDEEEHSIEMQFPYIFKAMTGSRSYNVVPIMVDRLNSSDLDNVATVLAPYLVDPSNLFVVSRYQLYSRTNITKKNLYNFKKELKLKPK